jgi:hypothetical protein
MAALTATVTRFHLLHSSAGAAVEFSSEAVAIKRRRA